MVDNTPVLLGQYRIGKTLGIGAFGKVKCKFDSHDDTSPFEWTPFDGVLFEPWTLIQILTPNPSSSHSRIVPFYHL